MKKPVRRAASSRVDVFTALADENRRDMLGLLRSSPLPVHEIARHFEMTRPAVSQHLRVLLDAQLVRESKVGRERHYRLHAAALKEVARWVAQYEQFWDDRLQSLGRALDSQKARKPR